MARIEDRIHEKLDTLAELGLDTHQEQVRLLVAFAVETSNGEALDEYLQYEIEQRRRG